MIVEANGGKVFCEVVGSGPALLIPGHASTPRFHNRVKNFSNEFTVIGCDVRGEAMQTDFPPGPFTMADLADDCAAVLEALGFERAHVVGLSHTGMVGLELALRHPGRVDRLVLTNTSAGLDPARAGDHALAVPDGEYTEALHAAESGSPEGIRQLSELAFSPTALTRDPSLADNTEKYVFGPIFAMPPEERAIVWKAYSEWSAYDRLPQVESRTMIITSDADRMAEPENHWKLWNGIPTAVLLALNGVGHDWYVEAPELVSRVVKSFLHGEFDAQYV